MTLPSGSAGEIVIVDNRRLDAVRHAVTVKFPSNSFFFVSMLMTGRPASRVLLFELGDLFELGIAVGMLSHGSILLRLATTISVFPQQVRHDVFSGGSSQRFQSSRNLSAREVRPFDVCPHRIAGGVVAEHLPKVLDQLRTRFAQRFASAPFFRWRCV